MLDDKRAFQKIKDELFLSKDKTIEIIKFQDEKWEEVNTYDKTDSLLQSQKFYIIIAGVLQISLVVFFFYQHFYFNNQRQ